MLILIFSSILFLLSPSSDENEDFSLQNGDLIFQESCSGDLGNAIKDVTYGVEGYNFTHVGIVWIDNSTDSIYVIEATRPKVCITPLSEYLNPKEEKCPPKSVVGRLKDLYQPLIPCAIIEAKKLVGKEYDHIFDLNNDQYYCSELIYDILLKANNNDAVFPLNVMTFKSKDTGEFSPNWIRHFEKLGVPVPEGEMGINPGAMSRQSDVLDIIHYY